MLARLRPRLTYANVVSTLCLFLVVGGGGAYASHLVVDSSDVVDNSLTGTDVRGKPRTSTAAAVNGSLTTDDIAGQQAHSPTGTPFVDGTLTQWDVKNGSLVGGDLANNTVTGGKVADNSLKGTDIEEASLGQVPSALLGGLGRWNGGSQTCDPEGSAFFVTCGVVTLDLPAPSRVLVTGRLTAGTDLENPDPRGRGYCRVATSLGSIQNSQATVNVIDDPGITGDASADESVTVMAITSPLGGGSVAFGVECREAFAPGPSGIRLREVSVTAVALSPN